MPIDYVNKRQFLNSPVQNLYYIRNRHQVQRDIRQLRFQYRYLVFAVCLYRFIISPVNISDVYKSDLPEDQIFLQFLSDSTVDAIALQNELVKKLSLFLPAGWYKDDRQISLMLEKAKEVLMTGFVALSPPDDQPNIIFYELSSRTDFVFNEPSIPLVNIEYNYNQL